MADVHNNARGASQGRCGLTDGTAMAEPPIRAHDAHVRFIRRVRVSAAVARSRHDGRTSVTAVVDAEPRRLVRPTATAVRDLVVALDGAIALGNYPAARRALARLADGAPIVRDSRHADGTARAEWRAMRAVTEP